MSMARGYEEIYELERNNELINENYEPYLTEAERIIRNPNEQILLNEDQMEDEEVGEPNNLVQSSEDIRRFLQDAIDQIRENPNSSTLPLLPLELSLLHIHFNTFSPAAEDCSICLCPLGVSTEIAVYSFPSCSHSYHKPCLDPWLLSSPLCPLCKANLREVLLRKLIEEIC